MNNSPARLLLGTCSFTASSSMLPLAPSPTNLSAAAALLQLHQRPHPPTPLQQWRQVQPPSLLLLLHMVLAGTPRTLASGAVHSSQTVWIQQKGPKKKLLELLFWALLLSASCLYILNPAIKVDAATAFPWCPHPHIPAPTTAPTAATCPSQQNGLLKKGGPGYHFA